MCVPKISIGQGASSKEVMEGEGQYDGKISNPQKLKDQATCPQIISSPKTSEINIDDEGSSKT